MPKTPKKKEPKLTPLQVADLSPTEKLARLRYLDDEINTAKGNLKAQKEAARDYIDECEAQKAEILALTAPEQHGGSVSQT